MKIILGIFLLSVSSLHLFAQTNNSPYSILGIGDIEDSYFNRTTGMANTGVAYRSNNYLINNNPASFSALTNHLFNAEIAIRGTLMNYYGAGVDQNNNQSSDITFKKLIVGTKITKHWGSSAGLVPFSSQNYEFTSPDQTLGTDYYRGYGGLNKVYWTNSYEFFNHLSVGVEAAYLFGSLQQKKIGYDVNGTELYSQVENMNLTNGILNYGIQYYGKINKKWDFAIGATYSDKTKLLARNTFTIRGADSTVLYPVNGETFPESYFSIPTSFSLGISVTKDKKYTFLADFKHQDWSPLNYTDYHSYSLQNSNRYSVGFEYSKKKNFYNTLVETRFYQAGFYYNQSYLDLYGNQVKDIGGTIGMGINSKKSFLSYVISLQYGVKGVNNIQQIQQKYTSITFAISYRDIWNSSKVRYN
jgi:hypothetical protein